MCGRYATTQTPASLNDAFGARLADSFVDLEPDYNMAPTKLAPMVIERRPPTGVNESCSPPSGASCPAGPRTRPSATA